MKYRIAILTFCLLVTLCGCQNNKKYAELPEELATLCKNIDKHPKNSELYYQRANYYYLHKDVDKGITDMQTAVKLQPDSSKYYIMLSDLYFAQVETDLAEEMLEKAIQKDPKNNEARLKLAELFYHENLLTQCNETLDEAIKIQKYNPKAYLIKAFMYKDMQDTTAYLRMLQLVIDQDPKEVKAYLELGYFYQKTLNPIAISYYQNALNVDPNNVEIHYNLGKLYQDLEQYQEAEQEYKTVIQLDDKHVPALNNLGYLYLDEPFNKAEDAVKLFTQAIKVKPDFVYSVLNRGVAYEYLGEYDKARKDYEKALKLQTNFEPAIKGLNRLDKLQSK